MNIKELYKWYSFKGYDPEGKELNKILNLININGKKVLMIGIYGAMHISPKLLKYVNSLTVLSSNRKVITYCKDNIKNIDFKVGKITNLKYPDKTFDIIVALWNGLHYQKNKQRFIIEFKRVLRNKGILLIEEADEASEYVKILNLISPWRKFKIKEKRTELEIILNKHFNVRENKLLTYYYFKNKKQLKEYFKKEIVFHEKKKFTKEMDKRLDSYITNKKTLRVEEKSIFFVCRKD